jgi:hypothetical protein
MVIGRGRRTERPQPTFCTTTKKKNGQKYGKTVLKKKVRGKKDREKSTGKKHVKKSTPDRVSSGEKSPTRADIAQLPVAHAQNTLPNRAASGHVTGVTSGQACARYHFR